MSDQDRYAAAFELRQAAAGFADALEGERDARDRLGVLVEQHDRAVVGLARARDRLRVAVRASALGDDLEGD